MPYNERKASGGKKKMSLSLELPTERLSDMKPHENRDESQLFSAKLLNLAASFSLCGVANIRKKTSLAH